MNEVRVKLDIKAKLTQDMKEALKAGNKIKVSTIRLLLSEIKNEEIKKRGELEETEVHEVLRRQIRRRDEAIFEYKKADRIDLAEKEGAEKKILEDYMPPQLSDEELSKIVASIVEEVGASSVKELGKVMGRVMPEIKGKADGKRVSAMVKRILEED